MLIKRIIMSMVGVVISAVAVGVLKIAALGVDPFQNLMSGLDILIPLSYGNLFVIVTITLLLFSLVADRHNIGLATFINIFLFGYITQFIYEILQKVLLQPSFIVRVFLLIMGVVVLAIGTSFYMTADLGVSTYDAIAIVMADKWKIGKFKYMRVLCDAFCVVFGNILYVIGGATIKEMFEVVGVGTIITAFFMGPLIDFFNRKVSQTILNIER
ncbi:MAG: YitT family protein [Roseburia sp.]